MTILTYTPDGKRVITAGSNSAIRIYTVGQDGEPTTVDEGVEGHFGIAATVCIAFSLNLGTKPLEKRDAYIYLQIRMTRSSWVRRMGRYGSMSCSQGKWKNSWCDARFRLEILISQEMVNGLLSRASKPIDSVFC